MFETKALYQNDPKWKNVKLGNQNQETIGTWGCLLTSLTMVANGFGNDETPETLNEKLKAAGGFQGALVIPAALPNVCSGVRYKSYQPCENAPAPVAEIDAALAAGMPVIVQVDWSPKAGLQTHWVVLYGKEGDQYLMKDPYRYGGDSPDKKLYLTDRYKHSGKDPAKAITGIVWFEGQASGVPKTPVEPTKPKPKEKIPADSFDVFGTADGLAFRSEPAISGSLISRLPLSVKLTSLEGSASKKKVGVVNEWLHVQDPDENQGYVAAWYLTLNEKEEEEKAATPVTGDKSFIVHPTTSGLAFRKEPVIQQTNIIRRLPVSAKLIVQEEIELAKKKIGLKGHWLKVKDVTGGVGFVASWYVTPASEPALGVRTADKSGKPSADDVLILQTTTEGVALRSEMRVAPETLIKRMPPAAELIADDDDESKVGVYGQWIKVHDIEDDEGYVAAWYVTKR